MKFMIDSLLLWPKDNKHCYRRISFLQGKVNIITGASCTGKSAIIPIIDYCLGTEKCTIPVGVIRDYCEWFGVLFDLGNEKLLLCRKEPGMQQSTGEMFVQRGVDIQIPDIVAPNSNHKVVKSLLNELFGISFLELDENSNNFTQRPSYRDFMAFLFQPQNIIANANVLFYKVDSMEHRQRLINLMPYALGAVTSKVLASRQEITRLTKEKDRLERELSNLKAITISWQREVEGWLARAREYGLTEYMPKPDTSFEEQVYQLTLIAQKTEADATMFDNNIKDMTLELKQLRDEEVLISEKLFVAQKRLDNMQMLSSSVSSFDNSLEIQRNRLDISGWLKELSHNCTICSICGNIHESSVSVLDELCGAISEIEKTAGDLHTAPTAFERELQAVSKDISILTQQLTAIQRRISSESNLNRKLASNKYTLTEISRFLGQVEMISQTYARIGENSELMNQIEAIDVKIADLKKYVNEKEIKKKLDFALNYISLEAGKVIAKLNAEHPDRPIEFEVKELTIKIKNALGRDDYLWEIGSASNWLAYHVAVSLAFQQYFQKYTPVGVPSFIIYDQPSQVYFPQKLSSKPQDGEDLQLENDEDKDAVKKLFQALSTFVAQTDIHMQVIVMEHADDDIWGDIENIHLVERWRGIQEKLVPTSWIEE